MKHLILVPVFIICVSCINSKNFDMPARWTSDFSISLYQGGGMVYASTKVVLTSDSCIYTEMEKGKNTIKKYKMQKTDQEMVLSQLKKFKVEEIKSEKIGGIVYDKGTTQICFDTKPKTSHCLSSSATEEIKEKYSKDFYAAYNYLLNFAQTKCK